MSRHGPRKGRRPTKGRGPTEMGPGRFRALVAKELREGRAVFIGGTLVMGAAAFSLAVTYDLVVTQIAGVLDPETAPPFVARALPLLADFPTYVWSQWFAKSAVQFGAVVAIILGAGTLAREFDSGTAETLMSRPVTRLEVVGAKAVAGAAQLTGAVVLSTAAILTGAAVAGKSFPVGAALALSAANLAGLLVILGVAMTASALVREVLKAGALTALAALLLALPGLFRATTKLSLYYWMRGGGFMSGASPFPWAAVPVMVLAAAGLVALSYHLVARSDI